MEHNSIQEEQLLRLAVGYATNPANTKQCTWGKFLSVGKDPKVEEICKTLAKLPDDKEHKEQRQALKKELPGFTFNSKRFKDNYRTNENATPSGFCMIDWDNIEDTKAWMSSFGTDRESQIRQLKLCGLEGFHLSPSTHGFHGIIKMRDGETIEAAQARVAQHMGKSDYDQGAHALSQLSYAVPTRYWLFLDIESMMDDQAIIEEPAKTSDVTQSSAPEAYDGVPMQLIVNAIIYEIMKLDKEPVEGTRNNRYFELQRHLRYFCSFNAAAMLKVAPEWGLPEKERRDVCERAVKYERVMGLPRQLQEMLNRLQLQMKLAEGINLDNIDQEEDPMPTDLPRTFELMTKLMPECFREPAFLCAYPFLGTLTTALRYKHHEVMEERTSFQVYLRGHMASGKGFTRVLNKYLMTPIDEDDTRAMANETEYRERCIAAGDGKKERDPHNVIRRIQSDFTMPALRKQLFNSRGQHMLMYNEESDSVIMNRMFSSTLRNAYDGVKTGQTRATAQSVNGEAETLINTMFCGTPSAQDRMYSNPEDGLVSRTIFVDLPDRLGFDEPEYGHLTDEEYKELEERVMALHKIGLLEPKEDDPTYQPEHTPVYIEEMPQCEELIRQFNAACKLNFFMNGCKNIALEKFARRIPTVIRRMAMVNYADEGMKETDRSIKAIRWGANRILRTTLNLYGHQYEDIYQKSILRSSPYKYNSKNSDLINKLPETFSTEDIITIQKSRGFECSKENARVIACRLKGYVEPTGQPNLWKKVKQAA